MTVEKRRYKVVGFRELEDGQNVRVILDPAPIVKKPQKQIGMSEMMHNPMGAAQKMMGQQMQQMIHDTFSISREEYRQNKYMAGDLVIVSIEREP